MRFHSSAMRYKLVAVDVDGTLLNSQKQLSKVNRKPYKRPTLSAPFSGISTGRPVHAAPYFTGLLGIEDLPFILYNGAMVAVGPSHKIIFEQGLSKADAYRIMTLGMELGSTLIVWSQNRLYVSEFNQRIAEYR